MNTTPQEVRKEPQKKLQHGRPPYPRGKNHAASPQYSITMLHDRRPVFRCASRPRFALLYYHASFCVVGRSVKGVYPRSPRAVVPQCMYIEGPQPGGTRHSRERGYAAFHRLCYGTGHRCYGTGHTNPPNPLGKGVMPHPQIMLLYTTS